MSFRALSRVRGVLSVALTAALMGACAGSAPVHPDAGSAGHGGSGGGSGGSAGSAAGSPDGSAGAGDDAAAGIGGAAGSGAAGNGAGGGSAGSAGVGGSAGTGGSAGAGGSTGAAGNANDAGIDMSVDTGTMSEAGPTCGVLGQACCATGAACGSDLNCLGGASCSCAKALFGRYLLRVDGKLVYETDPVSSAQTPVLDAATGLSLMGVTSVTEGYQHGCAVLGAAKTAWCWRTAAAGNDSGQLGSGVIEATGAVFRATQVLTAANQPLTNVVAVSNQTSVIGGDSTCASTADGKLYCWGLLTNITNGGTALSSPYAIGVTTDGATALTGVLQTSICYSYACALVQGATSKEVWCWGRNVQGQLGTGDKVFHRYPQKVVGLTNPTKVITFGSDAYAATTCALDGDNVRCWGSNVAGQIGAGMTATPILAPTLVTLMGGVTPLSGVVDIVGGTNANTAASVCARTADNKAFCWGNTFQNYPTAYGVANVVSLGTLDNAGQAIVRVLSSDGVYHVGATTRTPNCGLLQ